MRMHTRVCICTAGSAVAVAAAYKWWGFKQSRTVCTVCGGHSAEHLCVHDIFYHAHSSCSRSCSTLAAAKATQTHTHTQKHSKIVCEPNTGPALCCECLGHVLQSCVVLLSKTKQNAQNTNIQTHRLEQIILSMHGESSGRVCFANKYVVCFIGSR